MKRTALKASTALVALTCASHAWGQAPAATPGGRTAASTGGTAAAAGPDGLSSAQVAPVTEVIVTAQKRAESLEKVPVAVSAFTSKERDRIGIETVQDIANFTPGLEYSTVLDRAFLRGVGRQTNNLSEDPGLATYADGVYNSSVVAASGDSLFVDRVEVLRGPQGTLYGRNSIGGAINSISRRPTDDFYGEGRVIIGNYDYTTAEAAVSGPINTWLKGRVAAMYSNQGDGYYKQLSPNQSEGGRGNERYVEAQLQADPTPNLDIWAKLGYFYYNNSYRSSNTLGSYEYNPFPPGVLAPTAGFGLTMPGVTTYGPTTALNPANGDLRTINTDTPDRAHLDNDYTGTLQATYHFPAVDLKYIGGYTIYRYNLNTDYDGTNVTSYPIASTSPGYPPLLVFPSTIEQYKESKDYWSNELDLSSTRPGRFQWIAGLYQYREGYDQPFNLIQPSQPQIAAPMGTPANPAHLLYHTDQNMHTNSYAVFGQGDYQLTPQFRFTGGVRYTKDEKYGTEQTRQISLGLPTVAAATQYGAYTPAIDLTPYLVSFAADPGVDGPTTLDPATGNYSRRLYGSWGAVTGTAGVEWTPDTQTLAYAKYSHGYKSGGFNAGAILPVPEALPETIDAYEGGLKRVFSRTLQANLAVFYYNYDNLQIPLTLIPAAGATQTLLFNIDRSRSYGVELETTWQATPSLQFLLSYAYLDAKIRSSAPHQDAAQPGLGLQSVNDQDLPQSPRNKLALNGNYTWRFTPGDLTFSASYIYKDQSYDSIFNRPWYLAPSYSQVDMRLLFNDARGRYTVIAYAKNITDVNGYDNVGATYVQSPAPGFPNYNQQVGLITPRTYGIELQYRFH